MTACYIVTKIFSYTPCSLSDINKAGGTPTLTTPAAAHEAFLRRPELSPTENPHLQARTAELISKVENEIVPRLKDEKEAIVGNPDDVGNNGSHHHQEQHEEKEEEAEAPTAALMQNLKLCDDSTYTSGVFKELQSAKKCLDRAETMLLVS